MKFRFLCFLLTLSLLFSLISCQDPSLEWSTEGTHNGETESLPPTKEVTSLIKEPYDLSVLDSIPIAQKDMSVEELRQICVDFMYLQLTFPWQAASSVTYLAGDRTTTLKSSSVYGGMPYITGTTSSLYQMLCYYDEETGLVDTKAMGSRAKEILGNQCSGSTFWGWARVSDSISWGSTAHITPSYGAVLIGPYTHNLTTFTATSTNEVCNQNGKQTMYESYAALEKGDGIVCNSYGTGHVEMAVDRAVVVRNEDGTIDENQSYCVFQDHRATRSLVLTKDGNFADFDYDTRHEYSFSKLYGLGYLPFSLPEFHEKEVTASSVETNLEGTELSLDELMQCTIRSNYTISDLTLLFFDGCGNQVGKRVYCVGTGYKRTLSATSLGPRILLEREAEDAIGAVLRVRISTGESVVVFAGTIRR